MNFRKSDKVQLYIAIQLYLKAARYLDYSIRLFEKGNLNSVLYQTLHVIHRKYIDWFHLESRSKTKIHDLYH